MNVFTRPIVRAVLPFVAVWLTWPSAPGQHWFDMLLEAASGGQRQTRVPSRNDPAMETMTDARRDSAGRKQLFERVRVPGLTDLREGFNGTAVADLDRDGFLDLVVISVQPTIQPRTRGGTRLRVFRNLGGFRFREHAIQLTGQGGLSAANFRARAQIPVLADFNRDGFLDLFVTRSTPMIAGKLQATPLGNSFLLSQGRWDVFKDVSRSMGTANELAYNRQASFADVNGDGWLDIAVGADNIGNAQGGLPYSRLYMFRPKGDRFEDGSFEDIGGTALAPGFGGFHRDKSRDKAGPDINLRDLDNDGDIDLVQSYHVDCRAPDLPYSPCEYQQGVFVWRNMLRETGVFRLAPVTDNGLAEVGQLRYNSMRRAYETVLLGAGLPYLSFGDANNDGKLDVIAVGPSDPGWSPRAEPVGGRFWFNLGELRFRRATDEAGLGSLNWPYREWYRFQGHPLPAGRRFIPQRDAMTAQPGLTPGDPLDDRPYYAVSVFADFDNDGWLDLVVLDRRGKPGIDARAVLFMNRRDGTFEPRRTTFSGLDGIAITAEAVDVNNDGLLDLIFAADPDNSGTPVSLEQYESQVYMNTGLHGAREHHWLRLRFTGVPDASIIGARVETRDIGSSTLAAMRVIAADHGYKTGSPLEAHIGLGMRQHVDVRVILQSGATVDFPRVAADRFYELDLHSRTSRVVATGRSGAPISR